MWKNRLKDLVFVVCLLVLGWFTYMNYQSQKKVGYIDIQQVFEGFDMKKEMQKNYVGQMEGKKKQIDELGFELQQESMRIDSVSADQEERKKKFVEKRRIYMELVKQYDEEDQKVKGDYDNQIIGRMNEYVKQFGEENNYDLILGSSGNGNLMYASPGYDLTKEVLKYINHQYSGK